MRINLYAEELTNEVATIVKTVTDDEFGERQFYGIRLFLKSPDVLHHTAEDDDRSAVTFWVPWTNKDGTDFGAVANIFRKLLNEASNPSA